MTRKRTAAIGKHAGTEGGVYELESHIPPFPSAAHTSLISLKTEGNGPKPSFTMVKIQKRTMSAARRNQLRHLSPYCYSSINDNVLLWELRRGQKAELALPHAELQYQSVHSHIFFGVRSNTTRALPRFVRWISFISPVWCASAFAAAGAQEPFSIRTNPAVSGIARLLMFRKALHGRKQSSVIGGAGQHQFPLMQDALVTAWGKDLLPSDGTW